MGILNLRNFQVHFNEVVHVMSVHGNSILFGVKKLVIIKIAENHFPERIPCL